MRCVDRLGIVAVMNKVVRKKRKPDTLKVNFVNAVVGKRGSRELSIQPVTYPFKPSDGDPISDSVTNSVPPPSSSTATCFPPECGVSITTSEYCRRDHTVRKEKSAEGWSTVRPQIIPAIISASGFPGSDTLCIFCKTSPVSVWCPDCGPITYFCLVLDNSFILCQFFYRFFFSPGLCSVFA